MFRTDLLVTWSITEAIRQRQLQVVTLRVATLRVVSPISGWVEARSDTTGSVVCGVADFGVILWEAVRQSCRLVREEERVPLHHHTTPRHQHCPPLLLWQWHLLRRAQRRRRGSLRGSAPPRAAPPAEVGLLLEAIQELDQQLELDFVERVFKDHRR